MGRNEDHPRTSKIHLHKSRPATTVTVKKEMHAQPMHPATSVHAFAPAVQAVDATKRMLKPPFHYCYTANLLLLSILLQSKKLHIAPTYQCNDKFENVVQSRCR